PSTGNPSMGRVPGAPDITGQKGDLTIGGYSSPRNSQ
ncbi:unnamed protein product, partial [marine sediment metagenome]